MSKSKPIVTVKETTHDNLELINVQTGEVEETFVTTMYTTIETNKYTINLYARASSTTPFKTEIRTNVDMRLNQGVDIEELIELFRTYEKLHHKYMNYFDSMDYPNLMRQQYQRNLIREEILKEEKKYQKKILLQEVKRMARENVDARRPPVTAMIPKNTKEK